MASVETFMFFDHIVAPQGKSWVSRTRVQARGTERWLTVPLNQKTQRHGQIANLLIANPEFFLVGLTNRLQSYYGKAPYLSDVIQLFDVSSLHLDKIQALNEQIIRQVARKIDLKVEFKRSSDLVVDNPHLNRLAGNELVLELCSLSGANSYLSGNGCLDFIRPNSFQGRGIEFVFQNFNSSPYDQGHGSSFISGLSFLDCLAYTGWAGVSTRVQPSHRAIFL